MYGKIVAILMIVLGVLYGCALGPAQYEESKDLLIAQQWSGDYPVSEFHRLPALQQQTPVGYIGDEATFVNIWQAFKAEEPVPAIDFANNLVVFSRNVDFYNHTNIFKVTLTNGVLEVLSMETLSARPIDQDVAIAMAVIPRRGVEQPKTDETHMIEVR